jgi:hypothetical protein
MVVVGAIWALFFGMADQAGTYGQPMAALLLIVLGLLAVGAGKTSAQT